MSKFINVKISLNRTVQFPLSVVNQLKTKADFKAMFPKLDADICWAKLKGKAKKD